MCVLVFTCQLLQNEHEKSHLKHVLLNKDQLLFAVNIKFRKSLQGPTRANKCSCRSWAFYSNMSGCLAGQKETTYSQYYSVRFLRLTLNKPNLFLKAYRNGVIFTHFIFLFLKCWQHKHIVLLATSMDTFRCCQMSQCLVPVLLWLVDSLKCWSCGISSWGANE